MAKVGLKNIYVARILSDDENGTTYDTPRKLKPAMTVNITPNYETAELYGDDQLQEVEETLAGVDVEFGVNELDNEDYAYIFGKTLDANGGIVDKATDSAPYVAFGYELPFSGGRGSKFVWLYKGKFTLPSESNETKQGSTNFQTPTVSGKFMPRASDGVWRYFVESNSTNTAVTSTWFDEVKEPSATNGF